MDETDLRFRLGKRSLIHSFGHPGFQSTTGMCCESKPRLLCSTGLLSDSDLVVPSEAISGRKPVARIQSTGIGGIGLRPNS